MEYNKRYYDMLSEVIERFDLSEKDVDEYVRTHDYASKSPVPLRAFHYYHEDTGRLCEAIKAYTNDATNMLCDFRKALDVMVDFQVIPVQPGVGYRCDAEKRIDSLRRRWERVKELWNNAVIRNQENCEHDKWVETGHDSHYTYRMCLKCGKEERF